MKRILFFILILISMAISSQDFIIATDVWEPFRIDSEDGLKGIDIDIIKFLEDETGINFTIQRKPWARCLKSMENGTADLMLGLAYTEERSAYIEYLYPSYYSISIGFYSIDKSVEINEFDDLKDITIGYVTGSNYFQEFDSSDELVKISVPQESQLLKMLYRGNVDLIIGTRIQIEYEIKSNKWEESIFPTKYNPTDGVKLYIGISRKSKLLEKKEDLVKAIEKLLNSELNTILEDYK